MADDNVVELEPRKKRPMSDAQAAALERGRARAVELRAAGISVGGRPKKGETRAERKQKNKDTQRMATDAIKRLQDLDHTAIDVLEQLLQDEDPRVRMQTAKIVVEYRAGKPTQRIEEEKVERVIYEIEYVGDDQQEGAA